MSIIQKLIDKYKQKQAWEYLQNRMEMVTVKNVPLNKLLQNPENGMCYFYSSFIILGLSDEDRLVRGRRSSSLNDISKWFERGWVEFEFGGEWWVFDEPYKMPIKKEKWYNLKPYFVQMTVEKQNLLSYVKSTYGDDISKQKIWDEKHYLSLPYVNIETEDGATKIDIDKEDKFFVNSPFNYPVDWA